MSQKNEKLGASIGTIKMINTFNATVDYFMTITEGNEFKFFKISKSSFYELREKNPSLPRLFEILQSDAFFNVSFCAN